MPLGVMSGVGGRCLIVQNWDKFEANALSICIRLGLLTKIVEFWLTLWNCDHDIQWNLLALNVVNFSSHLSTSINERLML